MRQAYPAALASMAVRCEGGEQPTGTRDHLSRRSLMHAVCAPCVLGRMAHRIASHRIALPEPVIFRAFVPCAERGRAETKETVGCAEN